MLPFVALVGDNEYFTTCLPSFQKPRCLPSLAVRTAAAVVAPKNRSQFSAPKTVGHTFSLLFTALKLLARLWVPDSFGLVCNLLVLMSESNLRCGEHDEIVSLGSMGIWMDIGSHLTFPDRAGSATDPRSTLPGNRGYRCAPVHPGLGPGSDSAARCSEHCPDTGG
jgi:hypothetical protein